MHDFHITFLSVYKGLSNNGKSSSTERRKYNGTDLVCLEIFAYLAAHKNFTISSRLLSEGVVKFMTEKKMEYCDVSVEAALHCLTFLSCVISTMGFAAVLSLSDSNRTETENDDAKYMEEITSITPLYYPIASTVTISF